MAGGKPKPEEIVKTAPTWDEFFPQFIDHGIGEGEKASSTKEKRSVHKVWVSPYLGTMPLDQITDKRVSQLRATMAKTPSRKRKGQMVSAKTIANVMTVLNAALKLATRWKVIPQMPCTIEIETVHTEKPEFYDFDDYERLCEGAAKVGTAHHVLVRLGGDAGLRRGEIMALRRSDLDFRRRIIRVEQAAWERPHKEAEKDGAVFVIGKPKNGKGRVVPMTEALYEALQAHRHLRGEYVLCQEDGSMVPGRVMARKLEGAQRRAGLVMRGALHKLRHTFCSHLAMRGAPAKAIQELAGHSDLSMTMRYMHLSPSALDQAIALLNGRPALAEAAAQ